MAFQEMFDRFWHWGGILWFGIMAAIFGLGLLLSASPTAVWVGGILLLLGITGVGRWCAIFLDRARGVREIEARNGGLNSHRPASQSLHSPLSDPRLLGVGLAVLAVGVLLLFIPVNTQANGTKVGCGTPISRDEIRAANYDIQFTGDEWARILGYENTNPLPARWESATSNCTDRLTVQRWIAWPLVLLGAGIAALGVVHRREHAVSEEVAGTQQAGNASQPAGPPPAMFQQAPTGGVTAEPQFSGQAPPAAVQTPQPVIETGTPLPQPGHLAPPTGPALQLPPPQAAAGWYPSPSYPDQVQWFDGQQWTPHTRPYPQQ